MRYLKEMDDWASSWRLGGHHDYPKEWIVQRPCTDVIFLNNGYSLYAGDNYGWRSAKFRIDDQMAHNALRRGDVISFQEPIDHEGLIHGLSSIRINGEIYQASVTSIDGPDTYLCIVKS